MSDQENFLTRWSRRKRDEPRTKTLGDKPAAQGGDARKPRRRARAERRGAARAGIRPQQAALARQSIGANSDIPPSCKPACRRRSGMRRFVARGQPIRRSATSNWAGGKRLGLHAPQHASPATSVRTSTSRSSSPRFSARRTPKRRRDTSTHSRTARRATGAAAGSIRHHRWRSGGERAAKDRTATGRGSGQRCIAAAR